jgi:hypothetical protein
VNRRQSGQTKPAEDGSLFDIAKTKSDQIARIVLESVGLARSRNIRNALTQAIEGGRAESAREAEAGWLSGKTGRLETRDRHVEG